MVVCLWAVPVHLFIDTNFYFHRIETALTLAPVFEQASRGDFNVWLACST